MDLAGEIEWLRATRARLGWSTSQVAAQITAAAALAGEELRLSQQAVSNFEQGNTKNVPRWIRFARMAVEAKDAGRELAPAPAVDLNERAAELDLVPVAMVDFAYGMGGTFADDPVQVEVMQFPAPFMEAMSPTPSSLLTWARGEGDSMFPTIGDGDPVLIDRSKRQVERQDQIWAFTVGQFASIKRLRIHGDRALILSDNAAVPPDEVALEELNIVGRVTRVIKRI